LQDAFLREAPNQETIESKFLLNKDLLRERINYRVFQLKNGIWVSAPFSEVGKAVIIENRGADQMLTAHGIVETDRVKSDAKRKRD